MKRLILSGAIALAAATNCTGAKAGYYGAGASRYVPSTIAVTNRPPSGSGYGYNYTVSTMISSGQASNNRVADTAGTTAYRGEYQDIDTSYTRTGGKWVRTFSWVQTSPTDVRPTTATYTHQFTLNGGLSVYCPTPADPNTDPQAIANVTFYADGVDSAGRTLYDGGQNELRARKDGSVVDRLGQPATSPRSISNILTFYKTAYNVPATGDQSVEVRVECQALADGRLIPNGGAAATAQSGTGGSDNHIQSTNFVWNH